MKKTIVLLLGLSFPAMANVNATLVSDVVSGNDRICTYVYKDNVYTKVVRKHQYCRSSIRVGG